MNVTRLEIKNLGIIEDISITIDKPLLVFYGDIKVGKTTILNAVKWAFGGSFPDDIIRHGEDTASVKLSWDTGSVTRSWYRNREGDIVARALQVVDKGEIVKRPVDFLKTLLNPFLLDQDHFRKMGDTERRRYMLELFGVDTKAEDTELKVAEQAARDLRVVLKALGTTDVVVVDKPDIEAAKAAVATAKASHATSLEVVRAELRILESGEEGRKRSCEGVIATLRNNYEAELHKAREHNGKAAAAGKARMEIEITLKANEDRIKELEHEIGELREQVAAGLQSLENIPDFETAEEPTIPDYSEAKDRRNDDSVFRAQRDALLAKLTIPANVGMQEALLEQAQEQERKYDAYQEQLHEVEKRKQHKAALDIQEVKVKALRDAKVKKLESFSADAKVEGLAFTEEGGFTYDNTAAGMLSTSQIMELSTKLESLYPIGMGITLIDRGESLGKSIYSYIAEANRDNKAILATVVGDRPAETPAEAQVWVVKDGRLEK